MLNKETTKKAQEIAQELKPLFFRAYELGKAYDSTREKAQKAHAVTNAYYYTTRGDCESAGLDFEELQKMKHDSQRVNEWGALYDKALHNESAANMRHECASINLYNIFNYLAAKIADYMRPIYKELAQRKGADTFAEIINTINPRQDDSAGACSVWIYCDQVGEGFAHLVANVSPGWACGVSGRCAKYYQDNPREVWHSAEAPALVDIETMKRTTAKIKKLIAKAEALKAETIQTAEAAGLLGFVEIITDIKKQK